MTFAEGKNRYKNELASLYDIGESSAIFDEALYHLTGYTKTRLLALGNEPIDAKLAFALLGWLDKLKTGRPLQYVLGEAHFYGLRFKVSESVLIPRPETEELVDWIIKEHSQANLSIIDLATGSGCIAISLKKHLPNASVSATDISEDALDLARQNALLNNLGVEFFHSDLLNLPETQSENRYDVIVSNPPYIRRSEEQRMHQNVVKFEPQLALFVPDNNPLLFYEAIGRFATKTLRAGGYLFFEINAGLHSETVELLERLGFKDVVLRKDVSQNYRMIKCSI